MVNNNTLMAGFHYIQKLTNKETNKQNPFSLGLTLALTIPAYNLYDFKLVEPSTQILSDAL